MASTLSPAEAFHCFPSLPTEIRLRIWQFAAPRRPRIVQVAFDQDEQCWRAWKDRVGSLPSIVPVSREARDEALRSYTRIFDAWVDLKHDTVFISDPLFTIRSPRSIFMGSKDAQSLKNLAFGSDIYDGLSQSSEQFPGLCEETVAILRKLDSLTHFTLVLAEDGSGFECPSDEEIDDEEPEIAESMGEEVDGEEEHSDDEQESTGDHDLSPAQSGETEELEDQDALESSQNRGTDIVRFLEHLEQEAVENMSKGYFKQPGNIHFETAHEHPDWWEGWNHYKGELEILFEQSKERHPNWIRPKASIMAVDYGLYRLGDFMTFCHILGDHHGVLEESVYPRFGDYEADSDAESVATTAHDDDE